MKHAGWHAAESGADCQRGPYCGDGAVQSGEACDFGSGNEPIASYGGCSVDCRLGPYCGDGVIQSPYEQCDDGNTDWTDYCDNQCRRVFPML
jgi:cysteine-rich repeat protein